MDAPAPIQDTLPSLSPVRSYAGSETQNPAAEAAGEEEEDEGAASDAGATNAAAPKHPLPPAARPSGFRSLAGEEAADREEFALARDEELESQAEKKEVEARMRVAREQVEVKWFEKAELQRQQVAAEHQP